MWEITLKSSNKHLYMLEYIEQMLFGQFGHKVVIGKYCMESCMLSIATTEENKNVVWDFLKHLLCNVFCQKFKYEYLENNLDFLQTKNEYYPAFLRVFTYFDLELENSIAYRIVEYQPCIILESFFLFKLYPLKNKWQDLCNITNHNNQALVSDDSFLNLLKFLIDNMESKTDCVVLSFEDECLVYQDKQTQSNVWIALTNNPIEIVCSMIDLSPQKIVLHPNPKYKTSENIINFLFEGKIKY